MTTKELAEKISELGLHSILVNLPEDDASAPTRFAGTLEGYLEALKTLGAKVVFVTAMTLEEEDFQRKVSSDDVPRNDEEEFDGEDYTIDLEEVLPVISKFRKFVGMEGSFLLVSKGGIAELGYYLGEPWWGDFQDAADEAIEAWKNERNEEAEKSDSERDDKTEGLRESLQELLKDRDFCGIKTIAGMIKYASEKIPDLDEIGDYELKEEIRDLRATIEARGLNKKRDI